MARTIVINHVTLDGVMQAPGHADEDRRDGFTRGGWATPGSDEVVGAKVAEWMPGDHEFLFGRRSYEGMLEGWNERGGPFKDALNRTPKHVVSRSADTRLAWPNSTLVHGDVPAAIRDLTQATDANLVTMGSGELVATLLEHRLLDVLMLMIHPIVLGSGRRLFADGVDASLRLTDSVATPNGVLVATYAPA